MILVKNKLNPFHNQHIIIMLYKYQDNKIIRFVYDPGKVKLIQYINDIHDLYSYLNQHPGSMVLNEQKYNRMMFVQ